MSKETMQWLNTNTLVGFTEKRGTAWHYRQGSDNHFPGAVPMERVERLLDLTFQEKTIHLDDGTAIPGRKAIQREDTGDVLGIFADGYKVHPYQEWLVDNVASILDADLQVGSAGLLRKGGQAWVQVEMEDTMQAAGSVDFRPFLTAATSVDGSLSSTYMTGATAVVCDNTLSAAITGADAAVRIRHSRNSLGRVTEVREALGILWEAATEFQAEVERLVATTVTEKQWDSFVKAHSGLVGPKGVALFPSDGRSYTIAQNKADTLHNLWAADERVSPWKGTAYGVLAAVNTARQHVFTVRGANRVERAQASFLSGRTGAEDRAALALLAKV